ncbi:MAG TPA: TonB family protein [Opitutaceae bacterium]
MEGRSGSAADRLGDLFYAGSEVPQDYAAAYRWYLRAVELGYKGARGRLAYLRERGWGTPQDFASAFALYRVLADEGDAWAANKVGYLLATGQGVERDLAEAVRWYRKGAEKGNVTAQMNLAYALRRGRGVARDPAEAARWLEKAAAQGNDGAAVILSEMLWRGEDMMPDRAEAIARLERLVEKGFAPARTTLAKLLVATGPQQDQARARALFAAGAAAGSSADQTFHGLLCLEGVGGPRDIATALADLELAANAGQTSAALFLAGARMGYRQPGVLPDLVAARKAVQLIKNPDKESAPYLRRLAEGGDLAALFAGKRMADTAMMPDDATPPEGALPWERTPEPTHQTPPIYPLAMRVLGMEGEVLVDFDITPAGRVEKARALRSSHAAFDDAAVSAVQQWRFKPGVKAGRARSTHIQVPIIFKLNEEPGSMRMEVDVERPATAKP